MVAKKPIKKNSIKKKVHKSLIEQLEKKGANIPVFENLIDDYMTMWDIKESLALDIKERGAVCSHENSDGIEVRKDNTSVKNFTMVDKQMLALLKELGLSTESIVGVEDDEL